MANDAPAKRPVEDADIRVFAAHSTNPDEIAHAVGWLEVEMQTAFPKLCGAVMSLCYTVQALEARLEKLERGGLLK